MQEIERFRNGNIIRRVLSFNVNSENAVDDIHIVFSDGRENGPIIERVGNDSPRMRSVEGSGYTTDPELQRLDSWFISKELKSDNLCQTLLYLSYFWDRVRDQNQSLTDLAEGRARQLFLSDPSLESSLQGPLEEICPMIQNLDRNFQIKDKCANGFIEKADEILEYLSDAQKVEKPKLIINGNVRIRLATSASRKISNDTPLPDLQDEVSKWLTLLVWNIATPIHLKELNGNNPNLRVIGYQGCGDLSMNLWNVAFIRGTRRVHFVFPYDEPVEDRTYTCLVKWNLESLTKAFIEVKRTRWRIEIAEIEFNRYAGEGSPEQVNLVLSDGQKVPVADKIEFATYGQRLIQDGEFLDYTNTILQFSDLRHIFLLPNLNPSEQNGDSPNQKFENLVGNARRPRTIFNRVQTDDVWLGEYVLLNNRNLQRAALAGPIQLDASDLGATEEHIEAALYGEKLRPMTQYKEVTDRLKPLEPGEWRKITEGRNTWYEIYFKRNVYPCSILGITEDGELISLAWRGAYSDPRGLEIEQAAKMLVRPEYGVKNALLIDEGGDVYQYLVDNQPSGDFQLPPGRTQVRAMYIFTTDESNEARTLEQERLRTPEPVATKTQQSVEEQTVASVESSLTNKDNKN